MNARKATPPLILAPAGSKASFLAAVAAGADAVYCGLKQFSARMEAKNFTLRELGALTRLAHDKGTQVYVAFNTLIKSAEIETAGRFLQELQQAVKPDAIILQDLALAKLAGQLNFTGRLILSTLANVGFPAALPWVKKQLGIDHVVVPRELDIDEIKEMAAACPPGLTLELFVHGALCYGVSGRCYWSSYLGGKSGLRGRCVQPCRRQYALKDQKNRLFSCLDLSLDVLVKVLLTIPELAGWKIEGRKKGPHYVYYTVKAYQILRDHSGDPAAKKTALAMLSMALGRRSTHFYFLPQRPQEPFSERGRTGSGLYVGRVQGGGRQPYLMPLIELLSGDLVRLGYEDESGHGVFRVRRAVPKRGRLYLKALVPETPPKGAPLFLIDRREKGLDEMIRQLEAELAPLQKITPVPGIISIKRPPVAGRRKALMEVLISRKGAEKSRSGNTGCWLSSEVLKTVSKRAAAEIWWCLPPVSWPKGQETLKHQIDAVRNMGGRNFILNIPWQIVFFETPQRLNLWAGPFCNLTNSLAIQSLAEFGFSGAIVSPELGADDYLKLPAQTSLPLGIVISANWPLCISRIRTETVAEGIPFVSPKGEQTWLRRYDDNCWIFPNWRLDLISKKQALLKSGFAMFVTFVEPLPPKVRVKKRPGLWNWDLDLG